MESFPITFHVALCKTRELPQIIIVVSGYLLMAWLFTCTCINVLTSPQRSSDMPRGI